MPANLHQIASQIVTTLRLTEPELDTSVGTPTRKIIDAVAEAIAEAYIDQHMLSYQYDIDAKIEADLDDFVQLFGMARMAAKRAAGTVVFTRSASSAETTTVFIPINTTIRSNTTPPVLVQTVGGGYMEPGVHSVTVPVQAVVAGPEGNLGANTLTTISSPIQGVGVVTNTQPLSGGTHQETDEELRRRWKTTVFRNLAGTEQMYLGIALDDPDCYHANVIGASKKRREQVQVVGTTAATTVDDAAFIFADPVLVGEAIDAGDILIKGNQYSWNRGYNPPRIEITDTTAAPDGTLLEVDFEYTPKASRNDPANKVTNRVDIWCGGQRAEVAMQSVVFRTNLTFVDTANPDPDVVSYVRTDFRRLDGTRPTTGNIFVPLAFGPILSAPATISIGGQVYGQASKENPLGTTVTVGNETVVYAYHVVHDDTAHGYSTTSRFGLEWWSGVTKPANNAVFTVGGQGRGDYTFNAMIRDIQDAVERWRLVGIDAKAHQAKEIELRFSVAIMYDPRTNRALTDTAIDTAMADYLTSVGFQGRVQVSDLLQVIHNVPGVDNVRFLHGADVGAAASVSNAQADINTAYNGYTVGIQEMVNGEATRSYVDTNGRAKDIRFGDNELPVFHSAVKVVKAQNSFGVG